MIKIYNNKEKREILIDEKANWVIVSPLMYMKPPYLKIEFIGFYLLNHATNCSDCNSFIKSFGRKSNEWFLEYNSHKYKINTENIGGKGLDSNQIKQTYFSEYENGTLLKLSLLELNVDELNNLLLVAENDEEYEKCIVYRGLITEAEK